MLRDNSCQSEPEAISSYQVAIAARCHVLVATQTYTKPDAHAISPVVPAAVALAGTVGAATFSPSIVAVPAKVASSEPEAPLRVRLVTPLSALRAMSAPTFNVVSCALPTL